MRILVFGASGQIGHFLLPRLRALGHDVVALSRSSRPPTDGVAWLHGTLPDAPRQVPAVDAVVSLGPLAAFAEWLAHAEVPGQPRVVAMSSQSVLSKRGSIVAAERALVERLAAAEAGLVEASKARGLDWTLLRSTLIYGAGMDRSLTPIARLAMRWRVFPLPAGRGLRQPVHADDLAQAVLASLQRHASAGHTLALGGGEQLSAAQMFARARRGLPCLTLPLPVPRMLLALLARAAPARAAMIARLDADLVADNSEAERLLGIRPRGFDPRW